MNIENYRLMVFWDKKKIGAIVIGYTAVSLMAAVALVKTIFDASIPAAVPTENVVEHNSASYFR
jgi:hypothetical protein